MIRLFLALNLAFGAIVAGAGAAAAEARVYRGEYTLSFLGVTVARMDFDNRVDEDSYSVKGRVASAGLGQLFDDTSGTLSASGRFTDEGTRPEMFRADYVSGEKPTMVDIRFAEV